ncbi:MAG: ATP-binding cassette subfamily B protein [Sphingobacteriales bacterium]|jgi:ATP-binding cassette subfamily B protein
MLRNFPFYKQLDTMDCGPTCLRMIAKYYGKSFTLQNLRERTHINREGVSFLNISEAAESIGFRTLAARIPLDKLIEEAPTPFIAHWNKEHFVVVYKTTKKHLYIADPGHGKVKFPKEEFARSWVSVGEDEGFVLLIEPTPDFYKEEDAPKEKKTGFKFLFSYLTGYRKYLIQLGLGLLMGSLLSLIFPFLTQSIVDFGIENRDIGFIYTILVAQIMLFFSRTSVDFIRSWILLHMGTRINISIISDFLIKLMKLPISFFDSKMIGDLMQRINDHHRIQSFLTGSTLNVLFSMINLLVFGIVLAVYNVPILLIFLGGSILYVIWVFFFVKKRRELDHRQFSEMSANQSSLIQLITGMQEIKLNNIEVEKRWEWERIQAKLFKVSIKGLSLNQYQQAGAFFINEFKNIIITFMAAKLVIDGEITLGMMLAITYIIGQMNSPIDQLIGFIHSAQDALISLERMAEIHNKDEEEQPGEIIPEIGEEAGSFHFEKTSFQYNPHMEMVLKDVDLEIPRGKITAIVGTSGSGKTTLLKLLLKFYEPTTGEIKLGHNNLKNINNRWWRERCGVVMQDGFIFSDSIVKNIALHDGKFNKERLMRAVEVANIREFIESLPLGYNTKIGQEGVGLSQGQKQRILIARSVYKNPEFIFFDEATNALDANNEHIIMHHLEEFFKGKTVIVVAHRLSTVKNADQIVVLERGKVIEKGTHSDLTAKRGSYYKLVKNQLELGA